MPRPAVGGLGAFLKASRVTRASTPPASPAMTPAPRDTTTFSPGSRLETSRSSALKTWFISGSSRGLGRAITEAALAAGDQVVATARKPGPLEPLRERFGESL